MQLFKRKIGFAIVALMMAAVLVISGCSKDQSPKETIQASMSKSSDTKSFNFNGSLKLDQLELSGSEAGEAAMVSELLKNAEISWTGAYRADPMLMEMNLSLVMKGDMAVTFNVPMIMTEKKVWIKIPNIPMFPLPETLVNKFVELDLEELAKESGQTMPKVNAADSQKFVNEVTNIVFKHVDEKTYLSEIKVADAGVPSDLGVDKVVQFHMDQAQLESFIGTVVEKIAPEVIDLLSNNEKYRELLQVKPEDLEDAKKELADAKSGDLAKSLEDMKKELKSFDLKVNYGIDKKDYPVYTDASVKASIESEELTGTLGFKFVMSTTNINGEPKFEIGEPKADQIIPMDELEAQLGGMFGGFGEEL